MRHCSAIIIAEATRVSQEEAGADDMKQQVDVMEKRNALVRNSFIRPLALTKIWGEKRLSSTTQRGTRRREHVLNTAVISETKSHRYYESYTPVPSARNRRGRGIICGMLADWPSGPDVHSKVYTLRDDAIETREIAI